MQETARDLLSRHLVIAIYEGLKPGREPMLRIHPPQPAKNWATFKVEEYLEYEKPGQYGDPKSEQFAFVPEEQDESVRAALAGINPGDKVKLGWNHDYVTKTDAGGGKIQSPERPVKTLEKA
eukprot:Hpha_TRINITY_DN15776_c3_g1::TRINITY_DN15776_c3_g1_i1::g.38780::m.38780